MVVYSTMKLTLSRLQRILARTALLLQKVATISLVIIVTLAINQEVLAKSGNAKLAEDIPDNEPSQHPSGKDKNTEHGNSGTQGKSQSNPDGNGADKRRDAKDGSNGGTQGSGDFDDNNGCGNDHDFADDNNGNCTGKHEPLPKPSQSPKPTNPPKPSPKPSPTPKPAPHKVKVCHATGSASNPYVFIEISYQGSTHGHEEHSEDVIPAPTNTCPMPKYSPSPTPSPQPSSSPSPTPSPTMNVGSPNDPINPSSNSSSSSTTTISQILSANVPKKLPETGGGLLSILFALGAVPTGLALSRYKKAN